MLPLTALVTAQTAPATPDIAIANGGKDQNRQGFEALLAAFDKVPGEVQPPVDPAAVPLEAVLPGGKILPDGGKDLPDGDEASPLALVTPTALPDIALPGLPPGPAHTAAATAPDAPAQSASGAPRPQPAPQAAPLAALSTLPRSPVAEQSPPMQPVLQVAATDLSEAVPLVPETARPAAPTRPVASLRVKLRTGTVDAPTRAANSAESLAALGTSPAPSALIPSAHGQAAFAAPTGPALIQTPAQVGAALPLAEAAQRPQDFAQLIDRLVAAREAAAPHTTSLSLAHADFGRIDLTFASDGQGLSVNLASADPDFARAVQAATASAGPASDGSAGAGRQSGQTGAQQDSLASQSQSQGQERRDGHPADQIRADRALAQPDRRSPETGIFA